MHHKRRQRWTTPAHVATWYGVRPNTVYGWIAAGHLRAVPAWQRHYTDDRPRKTARGRLRIYEADLKTFIHRARGGVLPVQLGFGPRFWRSG